MYPMRAAERYSPLATAPTGVASATAPSSVKIVEVPRNWILPVWTLLQKSFRRAQRSALGDRMDEVAIIKGLCEGSKVLLVAVENEVLGGVVLEFVQRPKGKACIVVVSLFNEFHDRDFPQWSGAMNRRLAEYAKDECGCYSIEAHARDGVGPGASAAGVAAQGYRDGDEAMSGGGDSKPVPSKETKREKTTSDTPQATSGTTSNASHARPDDCRWHQERVWQVPREHRQL